MTDRDSIEARYQADIQSAQEFSAALDESPSARTVYSSLVEAAETQRSCSLAQVAIADVIRLRDENDEPSEKAEPKKSELMQAYDRAVENAKIKQQAYLKSKMN